MLGNHVTLTPALALILIQWCPAYVWPCARPTPAATQGMCSPSPDMNPTLAPIHAYQL